MLRVTGLKKSFGIDELFHDVSFEVARGDKVGFVGANGAGKTTLMRCLLGQEETDGGTIQLDEAATIGYVEQQADFGTGTLYEEFLRAFAVNAGITLHVRVLYGKNSHHKVEAIFKALGHALRIAVEKDPRVDGIPSTKGSL